MLLLYTLRKRSKTVTKFFFGSRSSRSSQCDQESRPSRSRNNTSEINLSSSQGDGNSLKGKVNKPELSSSTPKMASAPLPYVYSSKNSSSVSMAGDHVLYTPSQMLSVPQRSTSAPIHVPQLPCGQDLQDHSSTNYTNKDTRRDIHSDEILIHHKRALPRTLPLTSAPPALTAKQILTAQKVDRVSRLPNKKLLHLFPPPPPPPSSPPPAIPSSASSSVSSSPASSPPPSPSLSKFKRPINYAPAPCVYLSTPPSTYSPNNASPLLKKGRRRSQSASATSPPKAKTMIPVPVTRSSRSSRPSHPSDEHHQMVGGFSSSSSSLSRKARHQRSRSSVLDGSNFSAPDLLQHYPTPPLPPSSPMPHSRPRLAESDPLRFPISTPMTVQIPRPVTWTFKGGRPRSPSDNAPSTPPMTPPRSRNGSVSSNGPRISDKRRQSVTSISSTVFSHGDSVSGSSVNTHYDSYDSDHGYGIASHFQQPCHQYQKKQSMESSCDQDHELDVIISNAVAKTAASGCPAMSRPMPMPLHATP
ncbi:hypothetical protein BG005_005012 [Podila minutissima]|nr:hypothetical protein BG005_005012 [Podila minutissima]